MIRTLSFAFFLGLCLASLAHGQISASLNDGDFIVITGDEVPLLGIDFRSPAGLLVPVPDGDASPFGFFLENVPNQVAYGFLPPNTVLVDGDLTLGVRYLGDITGDDLVGSWGGEEFDGEISFPTAPPVPDPVDPEPVDPGNQVIPEPTSGILAVFAALGLIGFRKRRS